jgi:hypothetical protein
MITSRKTCPECKIEKDTSMFSRKQNKCKDCVKQYKKQYYLDNKNKIKNQSKQHYLDNKEIHSQNAKQYYIDNKEKITTQQKEYRDDNKEIIKERNRHYCKNNKDQLRIKNRRRRIANSKRYYKRIKERLKNDPIFRMRRVISKTIYKLIKRNGGSKSGKSIIQYLPYSITEMKEHLEKQFEIWMTWSNYGIYKYDLWNDDNSATWTWNIDHIIPQSELPYTSMEDDNFQKCWALKNLRPYSAKQNAIDGASKVRHQ